MSDTRIVALVVCVVAALIAWRQWAVARAKLKLDLFEHRYALYELLWKYISYQLQDSDTDGACHFELQNSVPKFYFLFGREIGDFTTSALSHGNARHEAKQLDAHAAVSKEVAWFDTEAASLRTRFDPYLRFGKWSRWWE